jgi:hypothetical protein
MIYEAEKDALHDYAQSQFGHTDIPYRSLVKSLLSQAGIDVDESE